MSEDPRIELVRLGFVAWERGDAETVLELCDPEIEVYAPPEVGNPGTFHGLDGFLSWAQSWYEAWESFSQDLVSIEPVGARHVLSHVRQTGRGKESGIPVERDATWVYEVVDGRLAYLALFFDHEHAMALAREREGLAE